MLRQDYILREIERMVEFCLRAIGMKTDDRAERLAEFLEENCETVTGMSYEALLASESPRLVSLLYHPGTAKFPQLVACGAWLAEAGDAHLFSGDQDEARRLFLRGAEILAFVQAHHGHEEEFAPVGEHLARLQQRIDSFAYPPELRTRIATLLATSPSA